MSGRRVRKAFRRTFYRSVQAIFPLGARDAFRSFVLRQDPVARREEERLRRERIRQEKLVHRQAKQGRSRESAAREPR